MGISMHHCKICDALWELNDIGWRLCSKTCGPCCDNAPMGDQIETMAQWVEREREQDNIQALSFLMRFNGFSDASVKTVRYGKHHECLIPVGPDHTAHLVMDDDALDELNKMMEGVFARRETLAAEVARLTEECERRGAENLRLTAEIARLTAEVERLQSERRWIPVTERLPDAGVHVMATYRNELGMARRVCAFYAPAFTIQYDGYTEGELDPDYSSEEDEYYWPEGWYEAIDNWDDFSAVTINSVVTHWMPLPPTQAQGE